MTNPLTPPVNAGPTTSGWDRFLLWFAANRAVIGSIIGSIGTIFLLHFEFQGHDKLGEILLSVALMITGAYTTGAGMHKSDEHWKEKKLEATLPPQSRTPRRRKSDA